MSGDLSLRFNLRRQPSHRPCRSIHRYPSSNGAHGFDMPPSRCPPRELEECLRGSADDERGGYAVIEHAPATRGHGEPASPPLTHSVRSNCYRRDDEGTRSVPGHSSFRNRFGGYSRSQHRVGGDYYDSCLESAGRDRPSADVKLPVPPQGSRGGLLIVHLHVPPKTSGGWSRPVEQWMGP